MLVTWGKYVELRLTSQLQRESKVTSLRVIKKILIQISHLTYSSAIALVKAKN